MLLMLVSDEIYSRQRSSVVWVHAMIGLSTISRCRNSEAGISNLLCVKQQLQIVVVFNAASWIPNESHVMNSSRNSSGIPGNNFAIYFTASINNSLKIHNN